MQCILNDKKRITVVTANSRSFEILKTPNETIVTTDAANKQSATAASLHVKKEMTPGRDPFNDLLPVLTSFFSIALPRFADKIKKTISKTSPIQKAAANAYENTPLYFSGKLSPNGINARETLAAAQPTTDKQNNVL